jgi:hypothetical protein
MISEMEEKLSPEDKTLREWDRFFREDLHVDLMYLNDLLEPQELIEYRDKVLKPLLLKRVEQKVKDNSSKFPDILGEFKAGKGFFTSLKDHLYNKFLAKLGEIQKSEPVKEIYRAELKILYDFVDNSGCNYVTIKNNMEYDSHDLVSVEWLRCIYNGKKSNEPSIQNLIDFMNEGLIDPLIPPRNGLREMINPEIDNEYGIQNHSDYLLGLLRNFDQRKTSLYNRLRSIDPQYIKDQMKVKNEREKNYEEEKKKLINELKKMGVKFTDSRYFANVEWVMSNLKKNPNINPAGFEYKVLEKLLSNLGTKKNPLPSVDKQKLINKMYTLNPEFMRNNNYLSNESIETIEKIISFFKANPENKDATLLSIKAEAKPPAPPAQNYDEFQEMQKGTTLPLGPHDYDLGDGLDQSGGRRRKRTKKRTNLKHTRKDLPYKSRRDRHKSRRDRHKSRRKTRKARR